MGSVAGVDSLRIGGAARGVDFWVAFVGPTLLEGGSGISAAAATACFTAACLLGGGGGVELGVAKGDDDDDDAVIVCVW